MAIKPTDGLLYQWDLDRTVMAPPGATACHFALRGSDDAYCTEVTDGVAEIPNVLMQTSGGILVWATNGRNTLDADLLAVRARAKPPEYVYSATDVITVETAVAAAIAALSLSYEDLDDLPTLEGVEIIGDTFFTDYGLDAVTDDEITDLFA